MDRDINSSIAYASKGSADYYEVFEDAAKKFTVTQCLYFKVFAIVAFIL
jgi:hypothetical protein